MGQIVLACGNTVLVDDEDEHVLRGSTWRYCHSNRGKFYVMRGGSPLPSKAVRALHRVILGAKPGQIVDHINGDTLDNRRINLRFVTHRQNSTNAGPQKKRGRGAPFRGVSFCKLTKRWRASITDDCRYRQLGRFNSPAEAAFAYDMASLRLHGEFGRRNFLPFC